MEIQIPTPELICRARKNVSLTQKEAAALVHVDLRSWQRWEEGSRKISLAVWELFLIKTKQKGGLYEMD